MAKNKAILVAALVVAFGSFGCLQDDLAGGPEVIYVEGPPGPAGEPGQNGRDGRDGTDGTDGVDGQNGRDGADGNDGADGKDGADGLDGLDGMDGRDGQNGRDGADGRDGVDGIDGRDGRDGQNGTDGQDGAPGQPGTPSEPAAPAPPDLPAPMRHWTYTLSSSEYAAKHGGSPSSGTNTPVHLIDLGFHKSYVGSSTCGTFHVWERVGGGQLLPGIDTFNIEERSSSDLSSGGYLIATIRASEVREGTYRGTHSGSQVCPDRNETPFPNLAAAEFDRIPSEDAAFYQCTWWNATTRRMVANPPEGRFCDARFRILCNGSGSNRTCSVTPQGNMGNYRESQ